MKTILVTGSSGDIGKSIVDLFSIDHNIIAPTSNELNLESSQSIDDFIFDKQFNIDCIIHCAGINIPTKFDNIDMNLIQKTMSINTIGIIKLIQNSTQNMKKNKWGRILLISSIYSEISRSGRMVYSMSKSALNSMSRSMAIEFGNNGILVNSLSPGFVDTKLTKQNNTKEKIQSIEKKIPVGRLASANDIAKIAKFLCSDLNTYITGQNIIADGGYTIGDFENE